MRGTMRWQRGQASGPGEVFLPGSEEGEGRARRGLSQPGTNPPQPGWRLPARRAEGPPRRLDDENLEGLYDDRDRFVVDTETLLAEPVLRPRRRR